MPIRHIGLFLLTLLYSLGIAAQVSGGGTPYSIQQKITKPNAREILAKPFISKRSVLKSASLEPHYKTLKFAEPIKTSYTPDNSGEWLTTADGTRIWRLSIESKGAASLNVIFSRYKLPEGAKLFLFSPDGSQIQGAYTAANNKSFGMLPTMPILGDELMIEYSEPANVIFQGELEIGQINYDFLGVHNALSAVPVGSFGASEACEENASCFSDWTVERKGVMKIIVNGTELCTGVMVANTSRDNTPLVLSASHCFEDYGYQASTALFIFNYECPNCEPNIEGTREQSIAGGYMRAYSEIEAEKNLDYALVEMSLPPPPSYDAYFCGWDIRDKDGKESTVIHHPAGDVKKLSIDFDSLGTISLVVDGFKFYPAGHWRVFEWELGVTEGGSSGAPLFNKNRRIMGGLSAGSASCETPIDDFFFKLSKAWNTHPSIDQRLKYWIDSDNTGEQYMDGYYPSYGENIQTLSNISQDDVMGVITFDDAFGKGYQTGDNSSSVYRYAERFTTDDSFKILGFYFVPFMGQNSVLTPVTFKIWEGEDNPDKELWSKKLELKEWIRRQNVDNSNFGTSGGYYIKSNFDDKECFISLEDSVIISDAFFIGFEVPQSSPEDTFAMYQVVNRNTSEDNNTSFFFYNNEWLPFTEHPAKSVKTSMWISPVVQLNSVITDTTPPDNNDKTLIKSFGPSNGYHSFKATLMESETEEITVEAFSISGKKLLHEVIEIGQTTKVFDLNQVADGIYIFQFSKGKKQESYKVVVLPD